MKRKSYSNTREFTDEQLIHFVSEGCVQAFEVLAERHQRRFIGIAMSILKNADDAADVVQTGMLKMFSKAHTFNAEGSFSGWSGQIVRNEALMLIRRRKRRGESPLDVVELRRQPDESQIPPDKKLQEERLRHSLSRALSVLPQKYRRPFELKMFDGLSVIEVAEVVGLSEGGVKTRLHRARAKLQQSLLRHDAEIVRSVIAA